MNCVICNDACDKYDGKEWITLKNDNYFGRYHPTIHYTPIGAFSMITVLYFFLAIITLLNLIF